MRIFIKFSISWLLVFQTSILNPINYFQRKHSFAHFPPTLEDSVNWIHITPFYFNLKFLAEKLRKLQLRKLQVYANKDHQQNKQISSLNVKIGNKLQRLTNLSPSDLNLLTQMSQSFWVFLHFDLAFVSSDDAKWSICQTKLIYDKILASTGKNYTLIFKRTNFT